MIILFAMLTCASFGCSTAGSHSDDPELIPFAIHTNDGIVFINTDGDEIIRISDQRTISSVLNSRYFYSIRTGEQAPQYTLYSSDGAQVSQLQFPPFAVNQDQVAVHVDDLTPELAASGVLGLPYHTLSSRIGWVESAGLLIVDLIDGGWVVLNVNDKYRETHRIEGVGVSWRMSDRLVQLNDRDGFSWVVDHDLDRVSPENLNVLGGPTGPYYSGQDRTESFVRIQIYRMGEMLFDLPNDFVNAYVFASGLTWAESSDGYGCVFSPSGEVVERRDGWSIQQSTTPCRYALFEIEGEEGLFVVDENIEIIARYPGVAGHVSITEDGYVRVNNSDERYRVFDRTGALIWEDATPSP